MRPKCFPACRCTPGSGPVPRRLRLVLPALLLPLAAACEGGGVDAGPAVAAPLSVDPVSSESAASTVAGTDGLAEPVALDRSGGYKAEVVAEAMRGIHYAGGVLAIEHEVARQLVAGPDAAASAEALAEGRGLIAINRRTEALAAMTRAVLLAPESAAAYEGLGDALTVRRKYPEAAAAFRAGLQRAPETAALHHKLADVLGRLDDRPGAIAELRRALELDPSSLASRERLAIQLYYTGDLDGAWAEVHRAEAQGGTVPPQFRALLAQVASEPPSDPLGATQGRAGEER